MPTPHGIAHGISMLVRRIAELDRIDKWFEHFVGRETVGEDLPPRINAAVAFSYGSFFFLPSFFTFSTVPRLRPCRDDTICGIKNRRGPLSREFYFQYYFFDLCDWLPYICIFYLFIYRYVTIIKRSSNLLFQVLMNRRDVFLSWKMRTISVVLYYATW